MPSITIGGTSYNYDSQARAIGGTVTHKFNPALSFSISKFSDTRWALRINRTDLVGIYENRSYALGVLVGLYTSNNGNEASFNQWMNSSITSRGSTIDAEEVVYVTYTKAEDSATPLVKQLSQSWWKANSSYSVSESVTYDPLASGGTYPRIRPSTIGSEDLVLIDIRFGNDTDRDNFIAELGTNIKIRMTVQNNGSTYVATSRILSVLETVYGGTNTGADPTKDNNSSNLRSLSMSFLQTDFSGGTPTPDNTNGFGHNLGWDANMGVVIEIFTS